jgi:hypothetical protein
MTKRSGILPVDAPPQRIGETPEHDIETTVARMLAAGREIRAHLSGPITSDHGCLYDENGFRR